MIQTKEEHKEMFKQQYMKMLNRPNRNQVFLNMTEQGNLSGNVKDNNEEDLETAVGRSSQA